MPIINGQKMACAPCIRGHRSTKCNHFHDRVMVPVRKPGRPLSTCPCPPGRPCACGGVRVAIPKKQKCGCSTGAADEPDGSEKEHSPSETPTSPSRPSFRVNKSNSASKTGTRKQSFDLANLGRMDPGSINLIASPNSNGPANGLPIPANGDFQASQTDLRGFVPGLGIAPAGPGSGYTAPQMAEYGAPMSYGLALQYTQPSPLRHGIKTEDTGLASPSKSDFGAAMPPPPFPNGSHTPAPISSQQQPAMLDPPLMPRANGIAPRASSCCGNKADASAPHSNNVRPQQGYEQSYIPQFEYPTIFTYPGEYGSWQHPINPAIWQQVISQTSMPVGTSMLPVTNGDAGDAGTSHQCSCGEGCQCVGCLAHPFNDQMLQYVNHAYSESNGSSPGVAEAAGTTGEQQASSSSSAAAAAGQDSPPPDARTPSDGSPEQSLSTLDYFFVNLPIPGLCGGHLGSCPCGESCDCPGCVVHGVPSRQG